MATWVVVGYYGFHNVGDEVLLQKTVEWIRLKDSQAKLRILCGTADPRWKAEILLRTQPFRLIRAIFSASHLVFGGGSLFQDRTSFRSFLYYFLILALARGLKKPITLLGHGFSTLRYPISTGLLRWGLKGTRISVRDPDSAAYLVDIGARPAQLIIASDLAYLNQSSVPASFAERTGLSLRHVDPRHKPVLAAFVRSLSHQGLLFYDCQPPQDRHFIETLVPDLPCNFAVLTRDNYFDVAPCPDRMIVMRYHALVWASLRGIPCLVLAYDSKVRSLAEGLGQLILDLTSPKSITLTELRTQWHCLEENHPYYQQAMQRNAQQLSDLANAHLTL